MREDHHEHLDLVRRAIAGDGESLSRLLCESSARLRETVFIDAPWRSVLDVDDVLQVTYLEAFLTIGRFTPGGPNAFFGWLKRIAENNVRDAVKELSAQKRPPAALQLHAGSRDHSVIALWDILGAVTSTPSRSAAIHEIQAAIQEAVRALPADYADVVRKYDLEGKPIAEVAAEMRRSPGAVHMLRARAHDRLRELLGTGTQFFSRSS